MIKNLFCAHFALIMADIYDENVIAVIDKVMITDIGSDKCLCTRSYGIAYQRAA